MCFTAKRGIKSHSRPLTDGQEVSGDGEGVKGAAEDTAVSGLRSVNLTVLWLQTFPYSVNMNHMKELQHTPSLKQEVRSIIVTVFCFITVTSLGNSH